MRDRDDHVLLGDHVLELELGLARDDLGSAVVALPVDLLDLQELLAHDSVGPGGVAQNRPELGDPFLQVRVLVLDLLACETGEPREPKIENRLRLDLRELELLHQARACGVRVRGGSDE